MRDLITDLIYSSKTYRDCHWNGEEVPVLSSLSNEDLLEAYNWFVMGVRA